LEPNHKGVVENSSYVFRADGTKEVFRPLFSYFGFRFVKVVGFPGTPNLDDLTCWFSHTDLPQQSSIRFYSNGPSGSGTVAGAVAGAVAVTVAVAGTSATQESGAPLDSAALLNGIQGLIRASALSNYYSHPTDCPSREKRGWTGDGGHAAETLMFNFDMSSAYRKWLDDIVHASIRPGQQKPNGAIPEVRKQQLVAHNVSSLLPTCAISSCPFSN
jgi:alpha-L-rhamnosidase